LVFIEGLGLIVKLDAGSVSGKTRGADFVLIRPKLKLKKAAISGSLENFNKLIN